MATTIEVEVMYNSTDPDTGTLLRKRVGLDAVHTLERENIWYIILSDDASSKVSAANARRTIDGVIVDRLEVVKWDDSAVGVALLMRRGGEVCLSIWESPEWVWHSEENPFTTPVIQSGNSPTIPADAMVLHFVPRPVSSAHSDYATSAFNNDMF